MNSYLHQINIFSKPLPSDNKKLSLASNRTPKPEYLYLPGSAFVVNLTAPNKGFHSVKS